MQGTDVLEKLIDPKILKILRVFFENDKRPFYLREISKLAKVPIASTFRVVNNLHDLKLLEQISLAKFKAYRLADNERTRFLGQLIKKQKQILQIFISRIKNIGGVEQVILYGKEEKTRASVFIIGADLKTGEIKSICTQILEEFKYIINALPMTIEQYNQMSAMGLYTEKKRNLYKK